LPFFFEIELGLIPNKRKKVVFGCWVQAFMSPQGNSPILTLQSCFDIFGDL